MSHERRVKNFRVETNQACAHWIRSFIAFIILNNKQSVYRFCDIFPLLQPRIAFMHHLAQSYKLKGGGERYFKKEKGLNANYGNWESHWYAGATRID